MDRNIRRALYTALVAGGLMLVAASAAHAAEALPEPDTIETSAAARGDLGAPVETGEPETRAAGDGGPVGDLVGADGILGSLAEGDVGGVVDGALGEDGLVDGLLGGLPPTEVPGPEEPGTGEPGVEEPGVEEPGTEEPGTEEPGTEEPGTEEPGTEEPGTEEPGTEEPGTEEPGTEEPGTEEPGTEEPGTEEPGTEEPGTEEPGTEEPGTEQPGTDKPGTHKPGTGRPGTDGPASEPSRPGSDRPGSGSATAGGDAAHRGDHGDEDLAEVALTAAVLGGLGGSYTDRDVQDLGTWGTDAPTEPAAGRHADRELPDGGVDITWGDKADVGPPAEYDGAILTGDPRDGLLGVAPESESDPEGDVEAKPVAVPGDTHVRTGHMFTGQLSLISLLLGLGIAVLRTRRR